MGPLLLLLLLLQEHRGHGGSGGWLQLLDCAGGAAATQLALHGPPLNKRCCSVVAATDLHGGMACSHHSLLKVQLNCSIPRHALLGSGPKMLWQLMNGCLGL
jgi:hypothetical protein